MAIKNIKSVAVIGGVTVNTPVGLEIHHYQIYNQKPKTWCRKFELIVSQIEKGQLDGIIVYLATPLFLQASKDGYYEEWNKLLKAMKTTKSLIIAYEDNLYENFDYFDYTHQEYLDKDKLNELIEFVEKEIRKNANYENIPEATRKVLAPNELDTFLSFDYSKNVDDQDTLSSFNAYQDLLYKLIKGKERLEDYNKRSERVSEFIENIFSSGIEVSTFKLRKDIAIKIQAFLEELVKNIFFSVYVSKEQMFSDEFSQFLKIFEKYLQQVEGINFTIDQQTSVNGVTYYFKSKDKSFNLNGFSNAINRFDTFIELCSNDPSSALELLKVRFSDPIKALEIIQDFTKKYQRLAIDIKHQQQKLKLMMAQDIENALLEVSIQNTKALIFDLENKLQTSSGIIESTFEISVSIENDERYTSEDLKILELARKYGESEDAIIVKSNLEKLKDKELTLGDKQNAISKIKTFLIKAGRKAAKHAEDISVKVLTTYLENQIKNIDNIL